MTTTEKNLDGEAVGQRLRRLRLARNLSQRELAGPGVSYAYISRIEAGQRTPSVKALRTLGRKLGVSPHYLETGAVLTATSQRELALTDAELRLRFAGDGHPPGELEETAGKVLAEAREAGEDLLAARAAALAGILAARRGDPVPLTRLAEMDGLSPLERPEAFEALAEALAGTEQPARAVSLLERALADVAGQRAPGEPARVRLGAALSRALARTGDVARADEVTAAALADADPVTDALALVRLYWTDARLAAHDGPEEALGLARRASELLRAHDDVAALARAHVDLARVTRAGGDAEAAGRYLAVAERLLGPSPDPSDLAGLRIAQAWDAVGRRDHDAAAASARDALGLAEAGTPEEGEARWALAEALALAGDVDAAGGDFESAVALLGSGHRVREATLAARGWGRMLRDAGREDAALDVLEQAATLVSGGAPSRAAARP